jgi:MHS family proline/betaine transporter-like MFS transporter
MGIREAVQQEAPVGSAERLPSRAAAPGLRRAVIGAAIGNGVEWFDFAVYGYLAQTLGAVFFPSGDPTVSLLASFAVFGAAFLVRPLGGLFFGPLGDRVGRQRTLATVIILMSLSTLAIGLLPGYDSIGVLAPALLVAARLLQGFSVGGEFGGAATFLAEYSPEGRRGLYTSWAQVTALAGLALSAALVLALRSGLSEAAMLAWGWRIPFLLAGPLGLVGLYLRLRLEDTPAFRALREAGGVAHAPIREMVTRNSRALLQAVGLAIFPNAGFYIVLTYLQTHLIREAGLSPTGAALSTTLAVLVAMALIPPLGALSDRVGRRPLLAASCIGYALLTYPAFVLMERGGPLGAALTHAALGALLAVFLSAVIAAVTELFPTRVRYSGFALGHNLAVALAGGLAPFVATYLIATTGSSSAPAYYLIGAAVATLVTLATVRETAHAALGGA